MKQELWLFTMRFPFGNGEAFLENELPILAAGFQRVRLFPLMPLGEARPLPPNVETVRLFDERTVYRPLAIWRALKDLPLLLKVWRTSKRSAPSRQVFAKHRREFLSALRQAFNRERLLRKRMAQEYDTARVALYSYWSSDWATVLGIWKMRDPGVHFVTRMMGFDMFDHRAPDGWQRFQAFHVAQADHLHVIAEAGLKYMLERFPHARGKFSLSYLATRDHGAGPWAPAEELRIVSCSNLVALKRVHLIAEALAMVDIPVHWTHFGDGPERGRVETLVGKLPERVRVDLKGSLPNTEIMAWYRSHPVDIFVHASRTEGGAPVALQEAASFGIPLLAADAGGVRDVVTPESGLLLPHALTPSLLAQALGRIQCSPLYSTGARARVRAFWAGRFNAAEVHGRMLRQLL
jgi:glycosyltransferase involved in cell wall biosynthesis